MTHKSIKTSLLFILIIISTISPNLAQKSNRVLGNHYYKAKNYQSAINSYKQLNFKLKKGKIAKRIGLCYAQLNQPIEALVYLLKANEIETRFNSEELLIFGDVLRQNKQYIAASKIYHRIRPIPKQRLKACLWAQEHTLGNPFFNLSKIKLKSNPVSYSSFKKNIFIIFSNDKSMYCLSDTNLRTVNFTIPTYLNVSAPNPNKDSTITYFSSNATNYLEYNKKNKKNRKISRDGVNNLFIWEYKHDVNPDSLKILPFNHRNYSCTHPCYDSDTKRLYFASNMPNGYGGFDIYYSEKKSGGWSSPVNLGPQVNTTENEAYPFTVKNKLYFSSKGLIGYGGYDIFVYNLQQTNQSAQNMGQPINSPFDDFSIQFLNDTTAFLFSKRNNPKGINNLYKVKLNLTPIELVAPILFEYNQTDFSILEELKLEKIYAYYLSEKNMLISIEGHADNRGPKKYNMTLSTERAKNVVRFLENMGIPSKNIIWEGKGENCPVNNCSRKAPCNESKYGKNRRVDITLQFHP